MINIPPIKQSNAIKVELLPQLTKTWKVGQVLNATTQRGGDALSKVLIQVGQYTLEAKTPVALQTGQEIKLLVKSINEFQQDSQTIKLPLLNIIKPSSDALQTNQLAALKLRQFIAIQQSLSQLQQASLNLLNNKLSLKNMPLPLKTLLGELQQNIRIIPANINATQLKQVLLNSGIFLESKLKLLNNPTNHTDNAGQKIDISLNRDFKFQLLSIKSELGQLLPKSYNSTDRTASGNATQTITIQQIKQIETFIKQTTQSLNSNSTNTLVDKLTTLLPKDLLVQLFNLISGEKPQTPISRELQLLFNIITKSFQAGGGQQNLNLNVSQLQEQIQFRLLLLDLSQQIEQSISKITSLQLQPMSREGDNFILLLFNLVFKDKHEQFDINIALQQENKKDTADEENWSVILTFNFKTLGKVQSKINLTGNAVSNTFYTEIPSTADKIQKLLPLLKSGLTKAGLNIINLSVKNNLIDNHPLNINNVNLLDVQA